MLLKELVLMHTHTHWLAVVSHSQIAFFVFIHGGVTKRDLASGFVLQHLT